MRSFLAPPPARAMCGFMTMDAMLAMLAFSLIAAITALSTLS